MQPSEILQFMLPILNNIFDSLFYAIFSVSDGLRFWLSEYQGKEKEEVINLSSNATVRKMLSDKIMDLNKLKRKEAEKQIINE